jgi:ParB family chromosome partitioning protein
MATATLEAPAVQTKFEVLPLTHITPSPMNPRKRFDEKGLKELAESIKAHGVQQPIVVRPDGNKRDRYEIVVGERRYRASKLAGNTEIPALINHLSNAAALEIMVIENLQRENVHPLEEALGYEALMKKPSSSDVDLELGELPGAPKHTVQSIAAKVGKSVEYVYARLKLLALVPASREAFEQGHITAGHAVLIARLQPGDQLKALAACFKNYVTQFEDQAIKKLDPKVATWAALGDAVNLDFGEDADEGDTYIGMAPALRLASEKFLREWIQEHINLKLKGVPWDLDDDKLVAGAGACALCPKRSMSNPSLFAELTKKGEDDTCFDPACFQAKQKAYVKLQVKSARTSEAPLVQISEQTAYTKPKEGEKILKAGQWLPAKKGECAGVTKALIVRGDRAGEHETVCADLNCKVHKRHLSSGGTDSAHKNPSARNKQPSTASTSWWWRKF